jgi:hypothetical protein
MADIEKLSKQEILELCTSVTIQLIGGVFRSAGVPPRTALNFLAKASGLTREELDDIEALVAKYAAEIGGVPSVIDLMSTVFMKMVEKRLDPPKTPENFGSSIEIVESVLPPVEVPEEKHEYNC